jgi:hypothetical protein
MNVRNAAVVLLAGSLAFPAFGRDIPPALLAHEAKVRPTLTSARKARLSGLESRFTPKTTVQDALALANANGVTGDDLFLFMIDYQRMLDKEAREDRKLAQEDKKVALGAKAAKLAEDNKAIDANMKEAEEKATSLMNAANAALVTGVVSGAVAGGVKFGPTSTPTPTPTPHGFFVIRK